MSITNTYEDQARQIKARKLVDVLRAKGATSDQVALMDESGWIAAQKLAGVRSASETTRQLVVDLLGESND